MDSGGSVPVWPPPSTPGREPYFEVREVLLHEAVDLTHGQAACLAALQGHGDQTAAGQEVGQASRGSASAGQPRALSARKSTQPLLPGPSHSALATTCPSPGP